MIVNKKIKNNLPITDLNDVYVVADFDKTITNGSSLTSWAILSQSSLVPRSYAEERQALYDYYHPIEINNNLDIKYKAEKVKEWFQKHISLFVKYKMKEEIFKKAATSLRIMNFRPFAKEFIEFLHKNNIPLIIISAGIGNFIESFLEFNNCFYDNIYVSSNKIIFKNGVAHGIEKNIIHSLNKNEVSLPKQILEKLKNRNQVILLGDQPSDLKMVNKKNHRSVISIGFLTPDYEINTLAKFFDIVCDFDDNYAGLKKVLFNTI